MSRVLIVGIGGFLGAIARYGLSGAVQRWLSWFPVGTLVVNVVGCFIIGALMSLVEERQMLAPGTRVFLIIGFLGSFTTFSAFGFETLEMIRHGSVRLAMANVAGNVLIGIGAVAAGWSAARAISA